MHIIIVMLFRRRSNKVFRVCEPYKEMSIKNRITRNNKWLLEMPSRETRDLVLQILSERKIMRTTRIHYRLEYEMRIDAFRFCLQILRIFFTI